MISDFYSSYSSFILSALLGISIGMIYDIFRILRIARIPQIAPRGKFYDIIKIPDSSLPKFAKLKSMIKLSSDILVFAEDIIFWIIISLLQIIFIYHINDGEIRLYFFIFSFLGALVYFFTVGKAVMYFSIRIIFLIRCLLYWAFYIIIYPIKKSLSFFAKCAHFFNIKIVIPAKNKNELKYSEKRIARILADANSGFLIYRSKPNEKKEKKHIS